MKKLSKNVNRILGRAGFTLVELLVVMAILGILIAVAIAGIGIAQRGARDNTRVRDLTSIKGLLEDNYGSKKTYATGLSQLTCSGTVYVYITGITFDCSANIGTGVKVQQGTSLTISTGANACTAGSGADAVAVNNNNSSIGYYVNGNTYNLCSREENGTLYQLGN